MVNRRRNNGNNNGNGNRKAPRRNRARQQMIPRAPLNPSNQRVQGWFILSDIPTIPANQTNYHVSYNLTSARLPGLAAYMTMYQTIKVLSLGARFKSSYTHTPGLVSVKVFTAKQYNLVALPNPVTMQFMRQNGSVPRLFSGGQAESPPANDGQQREVLAAAAATSIGNVVWVFEGPSDNTARAYTGEIEIFVDAVFTGRT